MVEPEKSDLLICEVNFQDYRDKSRSLYVKRWKITKNVWQGMQVCDQNLKDRLFRLPDFEEVRARHDCIQQWEMICN